MEKALNLIADYDNLIHMLPFIKTETFNELLNLFPQTIVKEIRSTLKIEVYLLFNKIGNVVEVENPLLNKLVTIVKIDKTNKKTYEVKRIIRPTWVFVYKEEPKPEIKSLLTSSGWFLEQRKDKYLLIRPGHIELGSV